MRPIFLVTNDDGLYANGLRTLTNIAKTFGEVVAVIPDTPRSGTGHGVTIQNPLRYSLLKTSPLDCPTYLVNGTPVDCIKLSLFHILPQKPVMILSGINHGSNASINVLYSGTMAAAIEGSLHHISSIGISHVSFEPDIEFDIYVPYLLKIIPWVLDHPLPFGISLNINLPDSREIKGIKWCAQTPGFWEEEFDMRIDTHQKKYFWLKGDFQIRELTENGDIKALNENYISIVPISVDMTAYDFLKSVQHQLK
ncbi:MAG: 5'/3'-nucleotidase SurE [Bacteroidales bacterium]|nr:5'/3'-nucleotidase SurE [Bacteroidales bacterium]